MNAHDEDRIKQLLRQALPPSDPSVLRRLDAHSAAAAPGPLRQNWFDWALLAGLIVFAASFPATIPVFLYYL
jgi:hypothetical protein